MEWWSFEAEGGPIREGQGRGVGGECKGEVVTSPGLQQLHVF